MPRYFLHIRDGDTLIEDPGGTDLADLDAARAEALTSAREILASKLRAGAVLDGQRFEITDETGAVLATVPLKEAYRSS